MDSSTNGNILIILSIFVLFLSITVTRPWEHAITNSPKNISEYRYAITNATTTIYTDSPSSMNGCVTGRTKHGGCSSICGSYTVRLNNQ